MSINFYLLWSDFFDQDLCLCEVDGRWGCTIVPTLPWLPHAQYL